MDQGVDELIGVGLVADRNAYWNQVAGIAHAGEVSLNWAEFGVADGRSCQYWLQGLPPLARLYAFDSWQGLPEPWDKGNRVMLAGTFAGAVPKFLLADRRVDVVVGFVEDTLPFDFGEPLQFCHIDTDLYSSAATILERIDDYLVDGTVLMFDEIWDNAGGGHYPNWREGEYKAYREWMERSGKRVEWFLQTVGGSAGHVRED